MATSTVRRWPVTARQEQWRSDTDCRIKSGLPHVSGSGLVIYGAGGYNRYTSTTAATWFRFPSLSPPMRSMRRLDLPLGSKLASRRSRTSSSRARSPTSSRTRRTRSPIYSRRRRASNFWDRTVGTQCHKAQKPPLDEAIGFGLTFQTGSSSRARDTGTRCFGSARRSLMTRLSESQVLSGRLGDR